MKQFILICAVCSMFIQACLAQQEIKNFQRQNWSIEAELFQPFYPTVHIIRVQALKRITKPERKFQADFLIGSYIRPNVKHDVVEKINEYMIALGARLYLYKGLHTDLKSNMGYAWGTRNLIDHKDYNTPTWFWEANIGYKFEFGKSEKFNLYINPQFGGLGKIIADIGPRNGKPDTFLHGNIILGINF